LDITAFIDVVLLLLLFFVLGSSFVLQPGIKVNPPRAFYEGGARDARYIVNITAQQPPRIFLNDQLTNLDKLVTDMAAIARREGDVTVLIRADRNAPYGVVSEALDRSLGAGLSVMLAMSPEKTEP
jgi:biopolymer transport protein ExbD